MARPFTPKILTANALLEGDVIYLDSADKWVRQLSQARLFSIDEEAEAYQKLALAERLADQVVGAYLADAQAGPKGPEPVHFREDFRRKGPSNYPHGKQS